MKAIHVLIATAVFLALEIDVGAEEEEGVKVGGALELNYFHEDFSEPSEDRTGDLTFGSLRLKYDGSINDVFLSIEYRMYSFMHTIRYGWMGYDIADDLQVQLGITKVPFGNLPYASHTFWETSAYPLGFEDDFDMGLKAVWKPAPWDVQLAFFKNDEYGNPAKLGRYSIDIVQDEDNFPGQVNQEINQGNLRVARVFKHGEHSKTEFGVSGQVGGLYNSTTRSVGDHWAVAAHLDGDYGPFDIMLEAVQYAFNAENPEQVIFDPGTGPVTNDVDDRIVVMGAFEDAYAVAAEGSIWIANVGYTVHAKFGPVTEYTLYNDFSVLKKREAAFNDSYLNTIGCLINAHPVWIYVDAMIGKNSIYIGGPRNSYAEGGSNEKWHTRFNVNITYYF